MLPPSAERLGHRFLALADSAVTLTASCFYRVGPGGSADAYLLNRIEPDWLDRYSALFWRMDPLHPSHAAGGERIATFSPQDCRRHPNGERYQQAFLAPQDTAHQIELYFRRGGAIVAGASLLRSVTLGAASVEELALLDRMVATVEAALDFETAPAAKDPRLSSLTARETDIARLLMRGQSDKAIAGALGIALPTAKTHVGHILAKTGAKSRAAFIAGALSAGSA